MKTTKKENIVGVSFFIVVLVGFAFWSTTKEKARFKNNGVLTQGVFVAYKHYSPARLSMTYSYNVDGKNYRRNTTLIEYPQNSERLFLNKRFPVIYIQGNPAESRILCSEADFKRFDIPFPDSLEWTKKYVLN